MKLLFLSAAITLLVAVEAQWDILEWDSQWDDRQRDTGPRSNAQRENGQRDARIIIVGSGVSGIAAGTKLLQNGFKNILYLEAENRMGGRIFTVPFADNVVDLGAQWVHGENAAYKVANPHGYLKAATTRTETISFIRSNGEVVDQDFVKTLLSLVSSDSTGGKREEDDASKISNSVGRFFDQKISLAFTGRSLRGVTPELLAQFFTFYQRFVAAFDAADSYYDVSSRSAFKESPGDQWVNWKDRGYRTFLELLMRKIPDPSRDLMLERYVKLNKTVNNIDWSTDTVQVQCTDGSSYTADHVISTISIGVMKEKYNSLFYPRLQPSKRNAIENINLGTANKIYMEFSQPFWSRKFKGMNLLWNAKDLKELQKAEDNWIEGVIGVFTVDFQPNLLEAFVLGKEGRRMELQTEEDVQRSMVYLLRKFLGGHVPEPIRILRTKWYSNPNFRGSWSHDTPHTQKGDRARIAKPLLRSGKPSVLFAGEATSDIHYKSVHGATETGWREAQRIIDYYGGKQLTSYF